MDLKAYYRKIREFESTIEDEHPVIKSLATESGGRAGRLTETPRSIAARMIVDGLAEMASAEETAKHRKGAEEAKKREEERRRASQVQFNLVSEEDLRTLVRPSRGRKE